MFNQTEGVSNPYKYAGGYLDASGYYLFGTRYYDPTTGRWTQQDPVEGSLTDLNSANRYTYADDDPISMVDPSGRYSTIALLEACVIGLVGGLVAPFIAALIPVILATGPLGTVTLGAVLLSALFGCLVGELGYNVAQLIFGG